VELLERDDEQAVLAAAIAESRRAGRVVVVGGEAGIGKTASSRRSATRFARGACSGARAIR
jgi:tRNA A37 threonylcarbamoyladenosine biosynthesis protein TsaE